MKLEYESPVMEVFSFDVTDSVAESDCNTYQGPGCIPDGQCVTDGIYIPSIL